MTTFIGTNAGDSIVPGVVTPGVVTIGPDATPGGGDDVIIARGGDDTVAGGLGSDTAALGAGDDTFAWAPADGSDLVVGQSGVDRLVFDGDASDETFRFSHAGNETLLDRDLGGVTMRLTGVEQVELLAGAGEDRIKLADLTGSDVTDVELELGTIRDATAGDGERDQVTLDLGNGTDQVSIFGSGGKAVISGLSTVITLLNADQFDELTILGGRGVDSIEVPGLVGGPRLVIDGGAGDDFIFGGDRDDVLIGGSGDDVVIGGEGDDQARLGAGADVFLWANGDGSDTVDGGGGVDVLAFDAGLPVDSAEEAEVFELMATEERALLTRDVGDIVVELDKVEAVTLLARAGADRITIGDLSRTHVDFVHLDLSGPAGGPGDGAVDEVFLTGSGKLDDIVLQSGPNVDLLVTGLGAEVLLFDVEGGDRLTIAGGNGNDGLNAFDVEPGTVQLTLDGGAGHDFIIGSDGDDVLLGGEGDDRFTAGAGNDLVIGGRGDERALLQAGDDVFTWAPGEGNDSIVGDEGTDTLAFDGSDDSETIDIFSEGRATILLRDIGDVNMLMETTERIELRLFGGTDQVNIGDVAGTDVEEIVIDLSGPDGAADFVIIEGTDGDDDVTFDVDGDAVVVTGLSATIRILGADELDQLLFSGFGGDDRVDASALDGIKLTVQAGDGDDVLLGSDFDDRISGDAGVDVILAAAGDDTLFGGDGEDVLDGGAGFDQIVRDTSDVVVNGEIVIEDGFLI